MLIDYHMHTRLTDGSGEPADYIPLAIARGLDEIGFSEHAPLSGQNTDWTLRPADLPTYVGWVRDAQQRYPQFPIKLGLEVDYLPGCADRVRALAAEYPWDYFLGSVHFIGDWPVDKSAEYWAGVDVDERWRAYFALWTEAARSGLFDSLAHPDLPKKFGFRPTTDFLPVYEAALQVVAAAGVAIEVSTAGLRKPCREIYPTRVFLERARAYNIPVTLGSDAHFPADVGADYDAAVTLLRACGYRHICRFTRRQRELVELTPP